MDQEARAHSESLRHIYNGHLRQLEIMAAKYGDLNIPAHISMEIEEYRRKIAELEARLRSPAVLRPVGPRHNLPPRDYEQFIGRQKEQAELRRLLQPYPKSRAYVITIDGIGGIGKSALALEMAYAFRDQHANLPENERFEAIVWVSAKRSYLTADGILERRQAFHTLDDLYAAIAQVLDYPAITRARAEEQRALVERVLAEQRTLLILDNLETIDDENLLVFLRELPDPTKALVTTRHRIDVAHPVRLTSMPHEDALALIGQEMARKNVSLNLEEQEQLWQRTGGLPLAIAWSVGLIGLGGSVESVLRRLGSGQSDIARFCFEASVAQIRGRDAHKLLLALSLFTTDASRDALGIVAGLGEDTFGRDLGLEELLRLSLVNKEHDRFVLLPLTRSYVRSEAVAHATWFVSAQERWVSYFDDLVEHFSGWSEDWRGHDLIEAELSNIFAVFNHLVATLHYQGTSEREQVIAPDSISQARRLLALTDRVSRTLRVRGYWSDCERLVQTAITISRLVNQRLIGWLSYTLARINYYRRDFVAARSWAEPGLAVAQKSNEPAMSSRMRLLLGLVELHSGKLDVADQLFQSALQEAQESGAVGGLSNILASMGDGLMLRGDYAAAISHYQQAVEMARQRSDLPKLASHLLSFGKVTHTTGHPMDAYAHFEESLKLARECGSVAVIGAALYNIAVIEYDLGQRQSSEARARAALDVFRRVGMKHEQAEAKTLLAKLAEVASNG